MELIFNYQLEHQRDIISTISRARRKWEHLYNWYPLEQRRLYSQMDHIYREAREKYDEYIFTEYAHKRRLNNRILNEGRLPILDKEDYCKFACLKPILDKYDRLPLLYYDEESGDPGFCQQQRNKAIPN